MCGIVGAIAKRQVSEILLEGLRRLEYRGYDSSGLALISDDKILLNKQIGKVANLSDSLKENPVFGSIGIAHTRWATHGKPSQANAHPHQSGDIVLVHNGIIENYDSLKAECMAQGINFSSDTDTEVIVHLIAKAVNSGVDFLQAVQESVARCEGAYALAVMHRKDPSRIVLARQGSPLVIGVGIGENFIASDPLALRQVTDRFIFLEEGDIAEITADSIKITDNKQQIIERECSLLTDTEQVAEKGQYRHFMLKEIYEQPKAVKRTLQGRLGKQQVLENCFGIAAKDIFDQTEHIHIIACGTSYHAGLSARYWLENLANLPCSVEVASEFRYRKVVVPKNTLFITISQSGETADTLAALRKAKDLNYLASLVICNVPNSSLVRESDLVLMTEAGPEVGVASTKAFTTQLVALQLVTIVLGRRHGLSKERETKMVEALYKLPEYCEQVLNITIANMIEDLSELFVDKHHALFLGRGIQYPAALEAALKLKEISYIHAEAYPAGELKHGPLALVDSDMPVIAVAPNDELIDKLKSNLEEVHARGGQLIIFCDDQTHFHNNNEFQVISLPHVPSELKAIVFAIPLQLLAYYVAIIKGTDVDQPRNLAKSVTVE